MTSSALLTQTTVDFLRHGEAAGGDYFRGSTDDPLSEQGWQQMFQQCDGAQWQVLISSPLRRCAAFASSWAREHQIESLIDPEWREIHFGDWEGQTAEQISQQQSDALQLFYDDPAKFTPPRAESYACFTQRIQQAWERLLTDHAGRNILVVTHAGVIRFLFSLLLAIPTRQSLQIEVPHACLTRFKCFEDATGRFVQFNFHRPV